MTIDQKTQDIIDSLNTYEVTFSYSERNFQTILVKARDEDEIRSRIEGDFERLQEVSPEVTDLKFERITPVEVEVQAKETGSSEDTPEITHEPKDTVH